MATHFSHALPIIVKNARFTLPFTTYNTSGYPADLQGTKLYQVGKDGAALLTCAELASNDIPDGTGSLYGGGYFITLTGAETNCTMLKFRASGSTTPTSSTTGAPVILRANVWDLPILVSGTVPTGASVSSTTITLASSVTFDVTGCFIRTTGGTGGGGTGGANNQARMIVAYNKSTQLATVSPAFEVTPSSTNPNETTYDILLSPLSNNSPLGRFLRPTVDERTVDVTATGAVGVDWGNVENQGSAVALTDTTLKPIYLAKLGFEQNAGTDKYRVKWYKDGIVIDSGVTLPTIQVVKEDGTNLIASTAMTDAGSNDFKYSEATNVVANGVTVRVRVTASIDSATRTQDFIVTAET